MGYIYRLLWHPRLKLRHLHFMLKLSLIVVSIRCVGLITSRIFIYLETFLKCMTHFPTISADRFLNCSPCIIR